MLHNRFSKQAQAHCTQGELLGWDVSPAFLGVAEGLPAWDRAVGRAQGGNEPWEAPGSPVHALGVAVGFLLCQGQGERSSWIFRAMSRVGTSQGLASVRCMSTARAQQAGEKNMLPQTAGKTRELSSGMKLQLPLKELACHPDWWPPGVRSTELVGPITPNM